MISPGHTAAREYAELGYHPIPVAPRKKRPLVEWKDFQTIKPTFDQLDAWWTRTPDANVGLVLGRGRFAVDLDGGSQAEALLNAHGISLPDDAPRSRTGAGHHVFLSAYNPIPDRVGLLTTAGGKPQVDIRGVGIVVVPPSIHPSGARYEWVTPLVPTPPRAPFALTELIHAENAAVDPAPDADNTAEGHWITQALRGVPEGHRDYTCTRLAGYFLSQNIEPDIVEQILIQGFAKACEPPYPAADVRKCVRSVNRRRGERQQSVAESIFDIRQALRVFQAREAEDTSRRMRLGIPKLDRVTKGIAPGEMLVLLARTGSLKTMTFVSLLRQWRDRVVLFATLEMPLDQLIRRLIRQDRGITDQALDDALKARVIDFENFAESYPGLHFLDRGACTLDEIEAAAREIKIREGQLDAIIIDHSGLVVSERSSTAYERASANAIGTKQLARRLDTVVGAIVQANRGAAKDTEHAPAALESARDSGCWEENADFVLALSQLIDKPGRQAHVKVRLQKNRRGPNVSLALGFDPKTLRMAEVDEAGGDER